MLKSFDTSLPDSTIASQAGIMQGAFAAAQLCTAMLWGRFSDAHGRKKALLIGLSGTTISCLGFGFSTTFWQALLFRMIGGATNGNVGVMRTMISEIVREKKHAQPLTSAMEIANRKTDFNLEHSCSSQCVPTQASLLAPC